MLFSFPCVSIETACLKSISMMSIAVNFLFTKPRSLLLATLLCLIQAGCGYSARDLPLDESKAREACTTFLKAWQEGKKVEELKPGIIGRDYAWDEGSRLVSFEILPEEASDGTNLRISARLTLQDGNGRESSSDVVYVVGTSPVVTVFRE